MFYPEKQDSTQKSRSIQAMPTSLPALIFPAIILITGIFTITSDLKNQKIYNSHLITVAILGLVAIIYVALAFHEDLRFHLINALIASVIGVCLYKFDLWRGGDAKLFALYAFLMPALGGTPALFFGTINLFACSFIAGMIILLPLLLMNIAANYGTVTDKILSREKLLSATTITIGFSWILFPVYHIARLIHFPAVSLVITYLIYYLAYHFLRRIQANVCIVGGGIIFGFLMRLWIDPYSLSWQVLPYAILKIGFYSALSGFMYAALRILKERHDRVPFAPLLFIGCVMSYTPFLTWIIHLIRR